MNAIVAPTMGAALAMSGGGFRSTLFQVGALWRMNELGLLSTLRCVSAVSGGSIAAGQLGMAWPLLKFDAAGVGDHIAFKQLVVAPLMEFCSKTIDIPAAIDALVNPFKSGAQALQESLAKDLFHENKLTDLPDPAAGAPRFIFNATSLQTGARFWMSREDLGDYQIGTTSKTAQVNLSVAVAASAAFPPIFTPFEFQLPPDTYKPCENPYTAHVMGEHVTDPSYHHVAQLCDGGTYDNLGLQELFSNPYDTYWVSDASSDYVAYPNYLAQAHWYQPHMLVTLLRVIDSLMRAGEARRRSNLIDAFKAGKGGAYWGTTTSLKNQSPPDALPLNPAKVTTLARLDTLLRDFGEPIRMQLVNWGYAVADRQIRHWSKAKMPATKPSWPYPKEALG